MSIAMIEMKPALRRGAMCRPIFKRPSKRGTYLNFQLPGSKDTWQSSGALVKETSGINISLLRSEEGFLAGRYPAVQLTAAFFLVLLVWSASLAQSKSAVTEIESFTTKVDRFVKSKKKYRVFADVSSEDDESAKWKEFKNNKALEGVTWYQAANVFTQDGKVATAKFTFTSPSGDWYHFIDYYFRIDGSLAKIHARLNTFYGNISVVRNRYYDSTGQLIKSTKRFQDVKTDKLIKKVPGGYIDEPIPFYKTVPALPFHKFL
jgi:hypothetical protein